MCAFILADTFVEAGVGIINCQPNREIRCATRY